MRSQTLSSQYVPSRQGVHLPQLSCLKNLITLEATHVISTVSSITMTEADPRIDPILAMSSYESLVSSTGSSLPLTRIIGPEPPDGRMPLICLPPLIPPPCV